jgi:hypothetical protein
MALSTTTGIATDNLDLLDAIRVFALAQGWTVNKYEAVGSDQRLHLSKSGVYVNFLAEASTAKIKLYGSTGYDGGELWDAQPGGPDWGYGADYATTNAISPGGFAYRLIANSSPDYVYAIAEPSAGLYKHILFGSLAKCGGWTGGAFAAGAYWESNAGEGGSHNSPPFDSGHVQLTYGGYSHVRAQSEWKRFTSSDQGYDFRLAHSPVRAEVGGAGDPNILDTFSFALGTSALNSQTLLWPMHIVCELISGNWFYAGTVPGLRFVRLENLTSGQVITLGSEDWLVTPLIRRGTAATPNSGYEGLAYRIS